MAAVDPLRLQLRALTKAEFEGFSSLLAAITNEKYPLKQLVHRVNELKQVVLASFEKRVTECNVALLNESIYSTESKRTAFSIQLDEAVTKVCQARFQSVVQTKSIVFECTVGSWVTSYLEAGGSPSTRAIARLPTYPHSLNEEVEYGPVTFGLEETWDVMTAQYNTLKLGLVTELVDTASVLQILPLKETDEALSAAEDGCKQSLRNSLKTIANNIVWRMERRFNNTFHYDKHHIPRRWSAADDLDAEFIKAFGQAERLLDQVSVFRLDPNVRGATWLNHRSSTLATIKTNFGEVPDPYAIMSFAEVSYALEYFTEKTSLHYTQAKEAQKKSTKPNYIPLIAVSVLLILVWYLLTNPLLLICVVIAGGFAIYRFSLLPTLIINGVELLSSIKNQVQAAAQKTD